MDARRIAFRGLALLLALLCTNEHVLAGGPIARYGDVRHMEFTGNETFTSDQIRDGLTGNLGFQTVSHPREELYPLTLCLTECVKTGYAHAGFPFAEANIETDLVNEQLTVHINEGARYVAGDVVILGLETLDRDRLRERIIARLTKPGGDPFSLKKKDESFVPGVTIDKTSSETATEPAPIVMGLRDEKEDDGDKDPLWKEGGPVPFDQPTQMKIWQEAYRAFTDMCRISANFELHLNGRSDGKTVDLQVIVHDEGVRTLVDKIELLGNQANSDEAILEFLDIAPGRELRAADIADLRRKLYDSGRFWRHEIEVHVHENTASIALYIDLVELPGAPLLNEPLPREVELIMGMRSQLEDIDQWPGDLVLEAPLGESATVHGVFTNGGGVFTSLTAGQESAEPVDVFVLASPNQVVLGDRKARRRLSYPLQDKSALEIFLSITVLPPEDGDAASYKSNIQYSLGVSGDNEADSPLLFDVRIDPVCLMREATEHAIRSEENDGVITIRAANGSAVDFDAESGRLLSICAMPHGESEAGTARPGHITFREAAFDAMRRSIESDATTFDERADPNRPLGSFIDFAVESHLHQYLMNLVSSDGDSKARKNADWLTRYGPSLILIADHVLVRMRKAGYWDADSEDEDETAFPIPGLGGVPPHKLSRNVFSSVTGMLADAVFERGSWPWIVVRDSPILVFAGQGNEEFNRFWSVLLDQGETGPIAMALLLQAAESADHTQYQAILLNAAAERLTEECFQCDLVALLPDDSAQHKAVLEVIADLRRSPPSRATVEAFLILFPESDRPMIDAAVETIRNASPEVSDDDVLVALADALWENGLEERIREFLEARAAAFTAKSEANAQPDDESP